MTANDWLTILFYFAFLPLFVGYLSYWLGANGGAFITRMKRSRHRCQNCHYLIKESPQLPLTSWNERERDEKFPRLNIPPNELEHDQWGGYKGYDMTVGCHKKIWTSEHNELRDVDRPYRTRELKEKYLLIEENLVSLSLITKGCLWKPQSNYFRKRAKTDGPTKESYGHRLVQDWLLRPLLFRSIYNSVSQLRYGSVAHML